MFYGQCWKCGERWSLGTASTCKCPNETLKREWVGLTDEEMQSIAFKSSDALSAVFVAEAKLKELNT